VRDTARLDDVGARGRLDELAADLQVHGTGDDVDALVLVRVGVRRDEFAGREQSFMDARGPAEQAGGDPVPQAGRPR
jgi:poly(A) polymerase Pap1